MTTNAAMVWSAVVSRSGKLCLWEKGGGATNTGHAQIITLSDGSKPFPLYIKGRGHLAGGEHALIAMEPGMFVIRADHHRRDFVIDVYKVTKVENEEVHGDLVNNFEQNWWVAPLDEKLEAAVHAAMSKANHYHCREPHYVVDDSNPFSAETADYWVRETLRLGEIAYEQTEISKKAFYLDQANESAVKAFDKLVAGQDLQAQGRGSIEDCLARLRRFKDWLIATQVDRIFFRDAPLQETIKELERVYEIELEGLQEKS